MKVNTTGRSGFKGMCSEFLGDFNYVSQTMNWEVKKTESSASSQSLCANVKVFQNCQDCFGAQLNSWYQKHLSQFEL